MTKLGMENPSRGRPHTIKYERPEATYALAKGRLASRLLTSPFCPLKNISAIAVPSTKYFAKCKGLFATSLIA